MSIADSKTYVDAGRRKSHTVYFPESGQTMKMERLIELLKHAVTAVYVDALFPNVLGDLQELAKNGVKVYHLRRLSLLSMLREQNGLVKNDENDAKLLSSIPTDGFRELTDSQIRLRNLVNEYYATADTLKQVRQREKITPSDGLEDIRKYLARHRDAIRHEILEDAEQSLSVYSLVRERLGLNGVSLATLLVYVDFGQGFDKILRQVGRTAYHRKTRRRSRKAIRALNSLAALVVRHGHERYSQLFQYHLSVLRSRKKALLRVQTWILKDIHHIVAARPLRSIPNLSRQGL